MVARALLMDKHTTTTDLIAFLIYASRFPFSFPSSGGNKQTDMPTLNWTWSTIGALKKHGLLCWRRAEAVFWLTACNFASHPSSVVSCTENPENPATLERAENNWNCLIIKPLMTIPS